MENTIVKKKKNVWPIIGIVIMGFIAFIIILFAIIPTGFTNPVPGSAKYITVWHKGKDMSYSSSSNNYTDIRDTLYDLNTKSTKANFITSLMQGAFNFKTKVTKETINNLNSTFKNDQNTFVIFDFDQPKVLEIDNKQYKYSDRSTPETTISYTAMAIEVNDTKLFEEITIYLITSTDTSNYQIKIIAHQSNMYSYIQSLSGK